MTSALEGGGGLKKKTKVIKSAELYMRQWVGEGV